MAPLWTPVGAIRVCPCARRSRSLPHASPDVGHTKPSMLETTGDDIPRQHNASRVRSIRRSNSISQLAPAAAQPTQAGTDHHRIRPSEPMVALFFDRISSACLPPRSRGCSTGCSAPPPVLGERRHVPHPYRPLVIGKRGDDRLEWTPVEASSVTSRLTVSTRGPQAIEGRAFRGAERLVALWPADKALVLASGCQYCLTVCPLWRSTPHLGAECRCGVHACVLRVVGSITKRSNLDPHFHCKRTIPRRKVGG